MAGIRKPFQGILNIVRFNWHFYASAILLVAVLLGLKTVISTHYGFYIILGVGLVIIATSISLLASFYIYDLSNLYTLSWLDFVKHDQPLELINIHAGFDETSALLESKFRKATLRVFDFYDPSLHTEIAIKRARKAYPAYPNTQAIETSRIPVDDKQADLIFLIFAAHEIRNSAERIQFFKELNRVLKPGGNVIVVEHLRNRLNFLAYTIGFLHFLTEKTWMATFVEASFTISRCFKVTPFVTTFVLNKNEYTP